MFIARATVGRDNENLPKNRWSLHGASQLIICILLFCVQIMVFDRLRFAGKKISDQVLKLEFLFLCRFP